MQPSRSAVRKKDGQDSQSSRAIAQLRQLLLGGEYRPGERIAELPLVKRIGVSRTPIRLALEKLAQEGLLEPARGGGFAVRAFTIADLWDAIEARGALEGVAARLAVERPADPRALPARLEKLREHTAAMASGEQYSTFNVAFHKGLIELSGSSMIAWALERFESIPFASPMAIAFPLTGEIMKTAVEHHNSIVDAVQNGDAAGAERIAREHARLARRNLEIALQDKNILARVPGASLIRTPSTEPAGQRNALWAELP